MKNKNPLNQDEKIPERIAPDLETDSFSKEEQKEIVEMVLADYEVGIEAMADWVTQRELDLKHYYGEKPSILENLSKRGWQSDRNLGLCAATCDIYQATLYSTVWNPDTLHFIATEKNDVDNKDNITRFAKWAVGKNEGNVSVEVDDFIHNRIVQGFSAFKIYWRVWYEWVDKRIPKKSGGYTIKEEYRRFEKGVWENIADVDDIIIPDYGKNLQEQSFLIHLIHSTGDELEELSDRKVFNNLDEKFIDSLHNTAFLDKKKTLNKEKAEKLGLKDITNAEMRVFPVDLYEWYGKYKRKSGKGKGKWEKYRFTIEPQNEKFLAGKPLRKITRSGKIPFVGGAFIRVPGRVRGQSLPKLIAPIVNAINNTYNQKSDFQIIENIPYGFRNTDEGFTKQVYDLEPGKLYSVEGDPSKAVYFPNNARSMAWAEWDLNFLLEVLEKLTGAAAYFLTTQSKDSTLGRDMLVNQKGETKFSLWVKRIMEDICEAINMYIGMYQDWAPKNLGERVLGKDGKELIRNLSIDTLRGNYDAAMIPDVLAGSKVLERQTKMWMFENLQQSIWLNPQINPKGNWNLVSDTIKAMGESAVERYMPPEPKADIGRLPEIEDEWSRFMQGDNFDPPEGATAMAFQHLIGHQRQQEEKYHELDEEAGRPAFDAHLFKTAINVRKFLVEEQQNKMANAMAGDMIENKAAEQPVAQPPVQPNIVQPQPQQAPLQPNQAPMPGVM